MYRQKRSRFGRPNQGRKLYNKFAGNQAVGFAGKNKSKLIGADHSIFIKKAAEVLQAESYQASNSFASFPIAPELKSNIAHRGYTQPTSIQDKAIGPMLEGRDLIGLANTGTGKTAAFLIPIINKIWRDRSQKALIVAPTRELATQINEELRSFSFGLKIYSAVCIGGASLNRQRWDLERNPNIVIGTPGRLKDLLQQKILNLGNFRTIVLDEVDLMVDIGFINDVKYFISLLPSPRQSLFFSATINPKVRQVLQAFVTDPVTVSVQTQPTSENVDQNVVKVTPGTKMERLHDLLIQEEFDKVMVFGRTKHGVEKLARQLETRGFKVGAIHGNRSQSQRQRTLKDFKNNQFNVLLATDVAARGLDIDNVSHVINYELPETYEDYIHRIGRTGRANKKGIALTFVE
ncbi:MAG: DEAD/DEAH box helicase [bacterium]|nr:DEAD/DEAH box helicase [bacterium]